MSENETLLSAIPNNPYFLLTPGPLSTSKGVRAALLRDWCTWDDDYNIEIVQGIRTDLVEMATARTDLYTSVLLQGSGSFGVEAVLGSAVGPGEKLLILVNGAYGQRMAEMAQVLRLDHQVLAFSEVEVLDPALVQKLLENDPGITHVAFVHGETTTGMLNPLEELCQVIHRSGRVLIVDAMSTFGAFPMDLAKLRIDYLISSANKCIQGVPGFCFVIAKTESLLACQGKARSLCLDLYGQWVEMDAGGKWRYTSPTHVVRAFAQAILELKEEGGVKARFERYTANQHLLVQGMRGMGFETLLADSLQSPMITSFVYPSEDFNFKAFYFALKSRGFVLYPGKISQAPTFRIGTIGDVFPKDIAKLLEQIRLVRNG
jgi:2-aminoethylphosphonate-pyruvate transaminase